MMADTVMAVQDCLLDEDGNTYAPGVLWDDEAEQEKRKQKDVMGLVSPTHIQNYMIEKAICKRYTEWYDNLSEEERDELGPIDFRKLVNCNTVDKFQGQGRDVVLMCYEIRNISKIVQIKEFIYNRRRFNVAVSRAKKKCILFLTDLVTTQYPECLDEESVEIEEAITFMCDLEEYMKKEEDDMILQFKQGEYEYAPNHAVKYRMYGKGYTDKKKEQFEHPTT